MVGYGVLIICNNNYHTLLDFLRLLASNEDCNSIGIILVTICDVYSNKIWQNLAGDSGIDIVFNIDYAVLYARS